MALERLTSGLLVPPWVRREHEGRYAFAARFVAGNAVIDCACGEGAGSRVLMEAGAARVIAVDVDPAAVFRVPRIGRLTAVCADGSALPLLSSSADMFVALETIEHIADASAFLAEARRCLRSSGIFICSTPNRLVTNPGTSISDAPFNPHHVREYSPEELRAELARTFSSVVMYGQVAQSGTAMRTFDWMASHVTPRAAARLRQVLKLPRILRDRSPRYEVRETGAWSSEYLVAVCVVSS